MAEAEAEYTITQPATKMSIVIPPTNFSKATMAMNSFRINRETSKFVMVNAMDNGGESMMMVPSRQIV